MGILFLKNPEKGASHIYRTLQPGRTAFCNDLVEIGLRRVLESGGFEGGNIQIQTRTVAYRWKGLDDLVDIMVAAFSSAITRGWSEEDRAKLPAALRENLSDVEKANASIEMVAYLAVARK
ncbi:hypothetical protein GB937_002709 [Aspergillus fischeri]|nr:hypothetical protein GB937_002709 [Aspergillus fischeri]